MDTDHKNRTRQKLSLDSGWRFHRGDIDSPLPNKHIAAYMVNKAGWARRAAKPAFDDTDWPTVELPHDWSVEGPFDPANHLSNGYLPRGVGWYRRYFTLDESNRGRYLALQFDGVATHCTVFVNGHVMHRNFCGYTPFTIDISDIANFGEELNVIAVRVDATPVEGWWYEGAGIYRHVWLINTAAVHFAVDGIFVRPEKRADGAWDTHVAIELQNASDSSVQAKIKIHLIDPRERSTGAASVQMELPARSYRQIDQVIKVSNPACWDLENPNLHILQLTIEADHGALDLEYVRFGFRTIRFDADAGFFLNDRPVKLLGTCNHQDHAGVGVAVPDSIQEFRIRRLKEMGSNAYRCAHNPPAPELLDACDRLGMLVMDENRSFGPSAEHLSQLRAMVRRDRNHPCVILWSLCNEEAIQGTPTGARIARAMSAVVKQLDPSRPVTAAVSGGLLNDDCIGDSVEVVGINYQLAMYDPFHAKHPHTPIYAAETHCSYSTRGVYENNTERREFASYDESAAPWGATARTTCREVSARPFVAGLFAWTGFDYRGEPTPHEWPSVSTHWGILDTCGFAKDAFYLHKAWFTPLEQGAFVHLLPHWNWTGCEGSAIRVKAYSNADTVELWLHGESLGRKAVDRVEMAEWTVPYRPGELKATAFCGERPVASSVIQTTGPAVALQLEVNSSLQSSSIPADGQFAVPVTVFATDAQERRVPTAANFVTFEVSGAGRIAGVGNGNPNCHEPDKAMARSLFYGLAQVIVQTTTTPGDIVLEVRADGLQSARLVLRSVASFRPMLPPAQVRHYLSDWRMSAITSGIPDPNQTISEQDMNSWERVNPANGPQAAWKTSGGHAIYRATFTPPKFLQSSGGQILFHEVIGAADVFVNAAKTTTKRELTAGPIAVDFPAASGPITVSVLLSAATGEAGLTATVELRARA